MSADKILVVPTYPSDLSVGKTDHYEQGILARYFQALWHCRSGDNEGVRPVK